MDEIERMRADWDARAEAGARSFVETSGETDDVEAFFAAGEERATETVDPVLESWDRAEEVGELVALDVGCGVGRTTRPLARRFDRAIGVDVSPEMVRRARDLNGDVEDLSFHAVDGRSFDPVGAGEVDFVFSYEVLQHAPSRAVIRSTVESVAHVLSPGGRCCLHFEPAADPGPTPAPLSPARRAARRVRDAVRAGLARATGDDRALLTRSDTWTGTSIAALELWRLLEDAGLELQAFRPDPTHEIGARLFAVADRPREE